MAKACAIRNIQTLNGRIYVALNYGTPPLPAQATTEFEYADEEELKAAISSIEDRLGEEGLALLHLAITYLRPDGNFNNVNQVLNKLLTLDPFAAQPLRVT